MPQVSLDQKKKEFKENFNTMTESNEGLRAYMSTFSDQTNAENLLASGGGEDLGPIEKELAALSAMNEIRISERQQAFSEDKLFASDVILNMRDKSYIEATGELNRRKHIKSHRYDKTRKDHLETSQKTMEKANTKIRALKERLNGGNGQQPAGRPDGGNGQQLARMQKVRSMEEIYDNIRVADRYFSEALALNKQEETKLKNKAELTYRSSLKRMYEREMQRLAVNSQDYRQIKRKYDENLRYYNELMKPILEERAKQETEDRGGLYANRRQNANRQQNVNRPAGQNANRQQNVNRPAVQNVNRQANLRRQSLHVVESPRLLQQNTGRRSIQVQRTQNTALMDKEAETNVSANVKVFAKFCATLNSTKYGRTADTLWTDMKEKANVLLADWETKTDLERGTALAGILVSANKFLTKDNLNGSVNKERAGAARQFRNFFKTTLGSMSTNCRVLALDEIYKELDRIEDDTHIPEKLKKENTVVFTEMARDRYKKDHTDDENLNEALKHIDDFHYRTQYYNEKILNMDNNVVRAFGKTKDFFLAHLKFDLERLRSLDHIADNFRVDRFGKVLSEDRPKYEQWKKALSDISKCDTEGALKMQRQWIQRFVDRKYKKEYLDEKTIRREGYEFKKYITGILNIQNTEKWSDKTEDTRTIKNAIAKWNAEHKNEKDKIKKGEYKAFDTTRLVAQRRKIQKLPGVDLKETLQFHTEQQFANKFFELKGCTWVGDFKTLPGDTIINAKEAEDFVKKGKTSYYTEASETFLIHNDGREFNPRQDVNRNGKLRQDRQNPLVLQTEHYKPGLIEEIDKSAPFTEKVDVEKSMKRVNAKEDRINTIERGAMTKIKDLVKNKNLGAAGQNELRALERLFEDFAKEADKQIYEKEKLITCDPDKVLERKNAFHVTAANYYKQKKNMNELFERLEKAQSDFIKKYAGEPAYQNWKTDLDNKRKESRKKEDSGTADGLTANQKMKMRIENENCNRLANYFTTDEQNIIKRNAANEGVVVLEEQIDRVAHVFILPVHRDFTGAFLTEKDRYNDSFNKRYKTAVLNNDKETQKALSREFTENVLKKLTDPFTADQLEKMNTVEEFEKKYTATKINEAHIKLCAIDNVYKNNTLLPALKTGLEELNRTNKKQYDLIDKKCNAAENAVLKYMIQSFGYNDEKYNDTDKRIQERCKTVVQTLLQQKKREEEEENRR